MGERRAVINPELVEAAALTARQVECLELKINGASYGFIGRALGITRCVAVEHCQKAHRRIAAAIDEGYPEKELLAA